MFEIKVESRRITHLVKKEVYNWLYEKILANEYNENASEEGSQLITRILNEQCVTYETYGSFIQCFDNSPHNYMMFRSKRKSINKITTDQLANYFVRYNGFPLPLGFVTDFFEDDYEDPSEIGDLHTRFLDADRKELCPRWRAEVRTVKDSINILRHNKELRMLKPNAGFIVHQTLGAICTLFMIYLLGTFMHAINLIDTVKDFIVKAQFNIETEIEASRTILRYFDHGKAFCEAGDLFTMKMYLEEYALFIALALVLLIIVLFRIKSLVKFIVFVCRTSAGNMRLWIQNRFCTLYISKGISQIDEYFQKNAKHIATIGRMEDSCCKEVPKAKYYYYSCMKFDESDFSNRIKAIQKKYQSTKYNYYQNSFADKKLCSGLVAIIIVSLVFSLFLIPEVFNAIYSIVKSKG